MDFTRIKRHSIQDLLPSCLHMYMLDYRMASEDFMISSIYIPVVMLVPDYEALVSLHILKAVVNAIRNFQKASLLTKVESKTAGSFGSGVI